MAVDYKPNIPSLNAILASSQLERYMSNVAAGAAGIARRYAPEPNAIRSSTTISRGRWRGVVTNTARGAMVQEYGTRNLRPSRPLGWALDAIAAQDPNRRRGARTR